MLQLGAEQVQRLQAIKRERDVRRLAHALAQAFPEMHARLGEQHAALVARGVQRGAGHGLQHAVCVARYLACWFMLGAAFEHKPPYAWARELLADPLRSQGAKVFQLCRRTREELARMAPQAGAGTGLLAPDAFEAALAALDAALMPCGHLGSLLPAEPLRLGDPCDVDAIDLRVVEPAADGAPRPYRFVEGEWQRLPVAHPHAPVKLTAEDLPGATPPTLPARLHVLSQPADGVFRRLRLRTRARHCCDPVMHPWVTLNGRHGLSHRRGRHAADVTLDLYAEPAPGDPDGAPQPAIAIEATPLVSVLSIASCGLRESGPALAEQHTQLVVYPGEQHLMVWHRDALPVMNWPESTAGLAAAPAARCRIERDGVALDASRWQAGLEDLDRQLADGLARLATAWERESGVQGGRLQAEPAVLCGSVGLTWGWAESPRGWLEPPRLRVDSALDLIACRLDLRFAGEFALHGSRSRFALHCDGCATLQVPCESGAGDVGGPDAIRPAQTRWRHPFALQVQALALTQQAVVLEAAGPVSGALVGACGLRPRTAGPGLQWFCEIAIEPASVALRLHDPLLGQRGFTRPLLPALKLVDWSLG